MVMDSIGSTIEEPSFQGESCTMDFKLAFFYPFFVLKGPLIIAGKQAVAKDFLVLQTGELSLDFHTAHHTQVFMISSLAELPYQAYDGLFHGLFLINKASRRYILVSAPLSQVQRVALWHCSARRAEA